MMKPYKGRDSKGYIAFIEYDRRMFVAELMTK